MQFKDLATQLAEKSAKEPRSFDTPDDFREAVLEVKKPRRK